MGQIVVGRHKPLYVALKQALYLSAGLSISMALFAEESNSDWSCQASETGQWRCTEKPAKGSGTVDPRPDSASGPRPDRSTEESSQAHTIQIDKSADEEASKASDQETRITLSTNLDWVPLERLHEQEKLKARANCCGAYLEPARDYPDAHLDPEKAPLKISADETEARGNVATMTGDVQVSQGYRQVRSGKAVVDQGNRTVDLDDDVTYREPGVLLTGDHAEVNLESGELMVTDVKFVLHESHVRGEANSLGRPAENTIYIDNALYTTCEPGNNAWGLRASSVEIDTINSIAVARNVRLNIKDVPVLYIPWMRYPLSDNRTTGLLFPNILTGNDNGLDLAQPIYINLAPNYDATVTPRWLQERGPMAEGEFRYMSESTLTAVSGGYLWDDDGGSNNDEYASEDRWTTRVDHKGGFGKNWHSLIDYTDVSDIDYFRDIDSVSLAVSSASHLNQQIMMGYKTNHWDLSVQTQQFETLILDGQEQYRQLPRLDANGHYRFGESDLVLTLRQNYVRFDHTDDSTFGSGTPLTTDDQNTSITGSRLRANYSVVWDKEWLWGFFKPRMTTKYITYNLDDPLLGYSETSPSAFVPVVSLDTGLHFERETSMLPGFVHSLEPRLFYVKSKYEDQSAIPNFDTSDLTFSYQQLFRDDRFSGGDRIGDTEQVTLGVTTRLIDSHTGAEKFRFSIGQVYYLEDRRVTLAPQESPNLTRDSSDIAAEMGGNISELWRYQADIITNDDDGVINKGSMSLRYNDQEDTVFNLSYRYTRRENVLSGNQFIRSDIDQIDTSFAAPVNDTWSLLGRYNYDLNTQQELEAFAGLKYSSCCWSVSVVARRWIDRDDNFIIGDEDLEHNNGLFFQIQFHGLAGTSTRVDNILRDGIYGYKQQDY